MKNQSKILFTYFNKNLSKLVIDGGSGSTPSLPNYDLTPREYLSFAEKDILGNESIDKVNAISNLKRALECQLDTLLYALHLHKIKPYCSNVPNKLDFMDKLGLISPHSFKKLNSIRNKIEHEYYVPKEIEIEIFYDLTFSLITSIEGFLLYFSNYQDIDFADPLTYDDIFRSDLSFTVKYNLSIPSIEFELRDKDLNDILIFNANNYKEFTFAFSTYILLMKSNIAYTDNQVLSEFNKLHALHIS